MFNPIGHSLPISQDQRSQRGKHKRMRIQGTQKQFLHYLSNSIERKPKGLENGNNKFQLRINYEKLSN